MFDPSCWQSAVFNEHVLIVPRGSLPRTAKGTVSRPKAEAAFAAEFKAVQEGRTPSLPTLGELVDYEDDGEGGRGGAHHDSLSVTKTAKGVAPGRLDHLMGIRTM